MRRWLPGTLIAALTLPQAGAAVQDRRFLEAELAGGGRLTYTLLLPSHGDPNAAHPTLLLLAGGTQNESMVDAAMAAFVDDEAMRRGWIVVAPVAPRGGKLLHEGHEAAVLALLDLIESRYRVESGKFHIAGVSNGGKTGFRLALMRPAGFVSLVGLPAFPPERSDFDQLERLRSLPVTLFAGERDDWVEASRATCARLKELGGQATLRVVAGDGHQLRSLRGGAEIFDVLEKARRLVRQ